MPIDPTPVRMCVCSGLTFEQIKALGIRSMEELKQRYGISDGCGSCEAYVRTVLADGRTAFSVNDPTLAQPESHDDPSGSRSNA